MCRGRRQAKPTSPAHSSMNTGGSSRSRKWVLPSTPPLTIDDDHSASVSFPDSFPNVADDNSHPTSLVPTVAVVDPKKISYPLSTTCCRHIPTQQTTPSAFCHDNLVIKDISGGVDAPSARQTFPTADEPGDVQCRR